MERTCAGEGEHVYGYMMASAGHVQQQQSSTVSQGQPGQHRGRISNAMHEKMREVTKLTDDVREAFAATL